ncbi:MAG: response regulator [Rhodocyclales bacterium GT-UBC]|nr:MAG: response regulator [Rhodocyclales bacterium GT-UBC]
MSEAHVLLVDDESLNLEILTEYFAGERDFVLHTANSGEMAWTMLSSQRNRFDLVLLDRMMPGLDGIGLLQRIKDDPRLADIPVILQTAANSPNEVREGLEAGAYYYLTKPYRREALFAIVHAALADARNRDALRRKLHQHINSLQYLSRGEFHIRSIAEAGQLASFLAQACPNADSVVLGISELLMNAVEHGNLGLSYDEKSRLKREDRWQAEVERLANLPEHAAKQVTVSFIRLPDSIELRISDEGCGFEWQHYLELSPERACDPNGRGIALARLLSFSSLHYEGCGNTVVATIATPATIPF